MPKIYIAGHRGMVGSALLRTAESRGFTDIVTRTHHQLDLLNAVDVDEFFASERPDWVFLAAAKVGGILANNTYRADFLLENLKIQNNIIESAYKHNVTKLLFLGSSCIYPKNAPQPIKETDLLTSPLESTNEPYAIAKIAGIKLCGAFNSQYGTNYMSVMPSNLYGIGDNYHAENGHVLPMLLRRFHEAKINNEKTVTVWGTGKPRREFLFADDMAADFNQNTFPKLYAPRTFDNGSSISHLDENTFRTGSESALMSPRLSFQEAVHDPGSVSLAILQAIGWDVNLGAVVSTNQIQVNQLQVYPNPARSQLQITWPIDLAFQVKYQFLDASGRTLKNGVISAQETLNVSEYTPGIYLLRLEDENVQYISRVVVIR